MGTSHSRELPMSKYRLGYKTHSIMHGSTSQNSSLGARVWNIAAFLGLWQPLLLHVIETLSIAATYSWCVFEGLRNPNHFELTHQIVPLPSYLPT